jgi:1-acyl-sn-glycerol-3-phosphate acyltransferase
LADGFLVALAVRQIGAGGALSLQDWFIVLACYLAPFLVLAPLPGALENHLTRRWILCGAAGYCLAVSVLIGTVELSGASWLGIMGLGSAIFHAECLALAPAAVGQRRLNWVNARLEVGRGGGAAIGLLAGWLPFGRLSGSWPGGWIILAVANGVALLAALPLSFPVPHRARNDYPWQKLERRIAFAWLAASQAVAGWSGALVLWQHLGSGGPDRSVVALLVLGLVLGSLLAASQPHPYRELTFVLIGWTGILVALLALALNNRLIWPCCLLGISSACMILPLRTFLHESVAPQGLGRCMAYVNLISAVSLLVLGGISVSVVGHNLPEALASPDLRTPYWILAGCAVVGAILAWRQFLRHALEQLVEMVLWFMYRITAAGPGVAAFPREGPVVVVANHTTMLDPFWIGKVLPRQVTPLMTSLYFDRPVIRCIMSRFVGAIRVPLTSFRREAPELQEAIKAIDQGRVVLIFPEGMIKRREEQLLRPFGQGIWRILRERPDTPVVVCRVEGGWGTLTSYCGGPPFRNKRIDWEKPVAIAVEAPITIKKEILADQRATRNFLMQACLDGRRILGQPSASIPEALGKLADGDLAPKESS